MKTPREKYQNDPHYKRFVDELVHLLELAHYTPSEVREMSLLACIIYEERHVRSRVMMGKKTRIEEVESALRYLNGWANDPEGSRD
jgi:hypothetical protein